MQNKDILIKPLINVLWETVPKMIPGNKDKRKLRLTLERAGTTLKDENGNKIGPKIVKAISKPYGCKYVLTLPPGFNIEDVAKAKEDINFTLNADCEIYQDNSKVYINAYMGHIPDKIKYYTQLAHRLRKHQLALPIGVSRAGFEMLELRGMNAHLLGGGITGGGKSTFLRQAITAVHEAYTPDRVRFMLGDLKGGSEFKLFKNSVFVDHFARDKKGMKELIKKANQIIKQREDILWSTPWVDIYEYNEKEENKIPSVLIVIDELAELDGPLFEQMEPVIRKGRSMGVHILGFLQRACSKQMSSVIKSQFGSCLVFKVKNKVNSQIFLDSGDASTLKGSGGRAIFDGDKQREVQVMNLTPNHCREIIKKYQGRNTGVDIDADVLT